MWILKRELRKTGREQGTRRDKYNNKRAVKTEESKREIVQEKMVSENIFEEFTILILQISCSR
uniref:Uncharacterized protein n=1 Tax=Rhizophagus irregularis (strain DAOM 181602 / DAOM 197198 / MUCL 43194) TaxID=747089 RepID=U9SL43_RHIID